MPNCFISVERCGLQAGQVSTWAPLLWSNAVAIAAEDSLVLPNKDSDFGLVGTNLPP